MLLPDTLSYEIFVHSIFLRPHTTDVWRIFAYNGHAEATAAAVFTRLIPLWFAASRAVEVVIAGAVARETTRRIRMPVQTRRFPSRVSSKKEGDNDAEDTTTGRPRLAAQTSFFSRNVDRERAGRSTRPPVPVPVWLGAGYVVLVGAFCVFSWARFAQLAAPCAAVETPWPTHCRVQAHPLFDFALPGPAAKLCACNTFAAAPKYAGWANATSSSYDCAAPRFMKDVHSGLFAGNALATTAPYVQTMIFYEGCAVNNTHVHEMFVRLPNLRVLALTLSSAIVPPLMLPGAAMTTKSKMLALRLEGMRIEAIPSEIGRLSETLSILAVMGNPMLRELPRELGECTKLGILVLIENALKVIPSELGRLSGLATLLLTHNKIASLPDELGSLVSMQDLWLSGNLLSAVPPSFGRMSSLAKLFLAANRLSAVPVLDSDPQAWPKLRYMNLEGNNISSWPNDWAVQKDVPVAELPFNTTARAVGDERDGLYDTYVAQLLQTKVAVGGNQERGSLASNARGAISLLVLMGGNPVVGNNTDGRGSGGARLLVMSRGNVADELPVMLVSSRPECAAGCPSTPWKAGGLRDFLGDSQCDAECNVLSCQYDGGDCYYGAT